jgi:hypothetical protein
VPRWQDPDGICSSRCCGTPQQRWWQQIVPRSHSSGLVAQVELSSANMSGLLTHVKKNICIV